MNKSVKDCEVCGKGAGYEPKQMDEDNGSILCMDAVFYDIVPCGGSGGDRGGAGAEAGEPDDFAHRHSSREGRTEPGSGDRDGAG